MPETLRQSHRFRRLISQVVGLPLVVLLLLAGLLLWQIQSLLSATHWVDHTDQVIAQANTTLNQLTEMELAERGYLLTGNREFRQRYQGWAMRLNPSFDKLERRVADNPPQKARAHTLRLAALSLVNDTYWEIQNYRGTALDSGGAARVMLNKAMLDGLRAQFAAFIGTEERLRVARVRTVEQTTQDTLLGTALCAMLGGMVLGTLALRQIRAVSGEYEQALSAEQRTSELLGTTLQSIGDAVLVTDAAGRVTQMNPMAEALTGWTLDKAQGRPSSDVFPIFNETKRHPVESPVDRVIREGVIVGLANHTILVRPDGTDIAIDDSGAPIRDGQGRLIGTVLVFRDVSERREAEKRQAEILEREHNIATRLQDALQPPLPQGIAGLKLADYYKPALGEAEVGGDFLDAFSVGDGIAYLTVGDLSGKGLAAAAQVATVRNMLRAFLYTRQTVAGAVTSLNRTLTDQGLLSGFATLFVARYDSSTHELCYVNCGQEPALVRRAATGLIETLSATGPVIGMAAEVMFLENTLSLSPGDALLVFTDGITEAGPSRAEMLGIEGVAPLVREGGADAETLVARVISGVEAHAHGGIRDDVSLLACVVSEAEASPAVGNGLTL